MGRRGLGSSLGLEFALGLWDGCGVIRLVAARCGFSTGFIWVGM